MYLLHCFKTVCSKHSTKILSLVAVLSVLASIFFFLEKVGMFSTCQS